MAKMRLLPLLLALCLLLGLAACAGSQGPGRGERLVIALDQEPATLDPYMHTKQQGFTVGTLVFETLIKKDADGAFIPWLATEWQQVDDTTLVFTLREDVTFHDGSPFTAQDAAYSLALGATSSFSATLFGNIDPVATRALDDHTLELKLTAPYAPLLEALASFRGAMLCKSARETMGEDAYGRAPVGTGPLRVAEWVTGDRIELEAYGGYWGEAPPFSAATARVIVEGAVRTMELETGGVDIALELPFSDWERIAENPNTTLISGESQSHSFILLNNTMPPTDDPRVRKALAHALDMENLVKTAYQGQAAVADSFYVPFLLGYRQVGPYAYDPDLARELLDQAGYGDGATLQYYTLENQVNMAVAEVVQSMWRQVGVAVEIHVVDLATMTQLNNDGRCPAASMAPTVVIPDPDAGLMIWPVYRTISIRHGDTRVQELLDAGRSTYDREKRIRIYGELQEYLFDRCYSIPLAFPKAAYGTASRIAGLTFAPSLVPDLTQVRLA